ncbi:MAG: hypothetical protein LKM32_07815 [Chiayiivirga sp.]|nr:hypothetical protein [Chiayiivirga sp.]MCI1729269.1 hypothetical protein [Chiayiivirga sp.]
MEYNAAHGIVGERRLCRHVAGPACRTPEEARTADVPACTRPGVRTGRSLARRDPADQGAGAGGLTRVFSPGAWLMQGTTFG